jgi:hypothetical protein
MLFSEDRGHRSPNKKARMIKSKRSKGASEIRTGKTSRASNVLADDK